MISPRTKPCRKECPTPKKREGYRSGHGRHTAITSYSYGTLRLKKGPNLPGLFFLHYIFFSYIIFYLITPFGIPITYAPNFLRLRLHSRLPLATYVRDSICDYHSRLTFATPFTPPICASRSRDSTAEGRTVLTP